MHTFVIIDSVQKAGAGHRRFSIVTLKRRLPVLSGLVLQFLSVDEVQSLITWWQIRSPEHKPRIYRVTA
jgi:hypothetical protein